MIVWNILNEYWLTCSKKDFKDFYNSIDRTQLETLEKTKIIVEKKTFDEKYNDNIVDNPAKWLYYYILKYENIVFLQPFGTSTGWYVPLNDETYDFELEFHKNNVIKEKVDKIVLDLTIEHFEDLE